MDIDKLIKGCKRGDRKSRDLLVNEFASTLMAVCNRYCSDDNIARDALQDTFINIFTYIKSYTGKGSFEGWMRKIAVHCSYAAIKKIREVNFENHFEVLVNMSTNIPDSYSQLNNKELLEILRRLPKGQYLIFNMKVIEGYSHEEISQILNIAPSTSRSNLARARKKLLKILQEEKNEILEKFG